MRTLPKATLVAIAIAILVQAPPAGAQNARWQIAKPIPQPLAEIASSVIGKKWYVFGGYDAANVQGQGVVLVYDAETETWSTKRNMPIPAHHIATVALGGKIYVFGGFVGGGEARVWQPIANALVYDPAVDRWEELAPMPTARGSAAAVTVNGKIYVIGGAPGTAPLVFPPSGAVSLSGIGAVEEYDPATNTWRARAPMPTGRSHFLAAAVDEKIYAINGRLGAAFDTASEVVDAVEEYDPKTDIWRYRGRSPTKRSDVAGAVCGGQIYVTGGQYEEPRGKTTFWAFEAYDPKANSWQNLPHLQIARHGFAAGFIGNEFHVAGGSFQSDGMPGVFSETATHEIYAVPAKEGDGENSIPNFHHPSVP